MVAEGRAGTRRVLKLASTLELPCLPNGRRQTGKPRLQLNGSKGGIELAIDPFPAGVSIELEHPVPVKVEPDGPVVFPGDPELVLPCPVCQKMPEE